MSIYYAPIPHPLALIDVGLLPSISLAHVLFSSLHGAVGPALLHHSVAPSEPVLLEVCPASEFMSLLLLIKKWARGRYHWTRVNFEVLSLVWLGGIRVWLGFRIGGSKCVISSTLVKHTVLHAVFAAWGSLARVFSTEIQKWCGGNPPVRSSLEESR